MHQLALPSLALALGFCFAPSPTKITLDVDYNLDPTGPRTPYLNSAVLPSANWLDIYRPDRPNELRPVVVYVHGGGWQIGDKSRTHFKDELFTEAGYVFVSVNYRLSPFPTDLSFPNNRVRSPMHVRDVAESIRWIQDNIRGYGGDGAKLTLVGHSAGAQIISLLVTDPSYFAARAINPRTIRGVVGLDTAAYNIPLTIVNAVNPDFKHQAFGTIAENNVAGSWDAFSATTHADPSDPSFFFVTQSSDPTRYAQSEMLALALGQKPLRSILEVNKNHQEINRDLGDPVDKSRMTQKVMDFVNMVNR